MKTKLFAILMMMVLVLTSVPVTGVLAAGSTFTNVQCGENVFATLDKDGTLVITGSGTMWDFREDSVVYDYHEHPWRQYKDDIKKVIFEGEITYVGAEAFYQCSNLTSVEFNEFLDGIGNFAFFECFVLKDIQWPSTMQSIGQEAFAYTAVEEVVLPDGITFFDAGVFSCCANLKKVTMGSCNGGSFMMGYPAFWGCRNLETIDVSEDHFALMSIDGVLYGAERGEDGEKIPVSLGSYPGGKKDKSYTIPDTVQITHQRAMYDNDYLEEVIIPEGFVRFDNSTFYGCDKLKKVDLPASVGYIEMSTFQYCTALESITIPEGVTAIEERVFEGCKKLQRIVIPKTVVTISESAFSGASNLFIYGYKDSYAYEYANKMGISFVDIEEAGETNPFVDVKKDQYYYLPVLWAVENGITAGVSATKFAPDQSCTRAQIVAFLWRAAGCPDVVGVTNPFKDVPVDAYYTEAVLWAVENGITAGVSPTKFGPDEVCTRAQIVTFLWRAFGEQEPTTTTNPFKDVPADAYYAKAVLWAVENNITAGLSQTKFGPDSPCTRGQVVSFLYRAYAKKVVCEHDFAPATCLVPAICKKCGLTEGTVGEHNWSHGICTICNYEAECLGSFDISANEDGTIMAYIYMTGTENVYALGIYGTGEMSYKQPWSSFKEKINYVEVGEGITLVDALDGLNIKQLRLPDTVTEIGYEAFKNSTFQEMMVLPDSVVEIKDSAFECAVFSEGLILSKNLKKIGSRAFARIQCNHNLIIPESVEEIGGYAFSDAHISGLEINSGIQRIGSNAFSEYYASTYNQKDAQISVGISIPETTYGNGVYMGNVENPYLILIGTTAKEITSIEIHPDTKIIYNNALTACTLLKELVIPNGVITIGAYAFSECSMLESVQIGNGVQYLEGAAFSECSKIKEITIPTSVTYLGAYLFYYGDSELVISYTGTIAQWESIDKAELWYWYYEKGPGDVIRVIQCTDGQITAP